MGSRRVTRLGLAEDTSNRLSARGLHTAGDVLLRSDLELMGVLDLPLSAITSARERISRVICPPSCTVLDILSAAGTSQRLPTLLPGLDRALGGGLPCSCLSELVGPSGVGKSQMCLMLALTATLPLEMGGLDGRVVLFDSERKFSSQRLLSIAMGRFPGLFGRPQDQLTLVERVMVITPSSPDDLLLRLKGLQAVMVRDAVRLIIVDSIAAVMRMGQSHQGTGRQQEHLGLLAVALKELAEGYAVPVVVTNQVSGAQSGAAIKPPRPQAQWEQPRRHEFIQHQQQQQHQQQRQQLQMQGSDFRAFSGFLGPGDQEWAAALGVKWAHAVNIRLAFHSSTSGLRAIHVAKAPMAPPFFTEYVISPMGLEEFDFNDD